MLFNCGVGKDSWESLGQQGDQTNPKGNQPWISIAKPDAEAPILRPPDMKSPLIGKDPDSGKDWRQEEKGMTKDEMIGWHRQLNEYEFEQAPGDGEGQGCLVCCSTWGHKMLDTTEQLNNNNSLWTKCDYIISSKTAWKSTGIILKSYGKNTIQSN